MTNLVLPTWQVLQGDALTRLREMPSESVHMCVTSPPYFGLRDYSVDGQIGLEPTPAEFIASLVGVFREVRRVLRRDGTCWVNMGDSYAGGSSTTDKIFGNPEFNNGRPSRTLTKRPIKKSPSGYKPKDLMMMPARVAIALQDDGWYLRSEITWCKRAPMPESVTDRPTSATEKIFLLAREQRYFYDQEAVREAPKPENNGWMRAPQLGVHRQLDPYSRVTVKQYDEIKGANMRNYWLLSPEPYPEAHFATFPTEIPRRAIKAGTSEHGCCPECGAQWRRVVDREPTPQHILDEFNESRQRSIAETGRMDGHTNYRPDYTRKVLGTSWQPTCKHDHTPVPCTVLDPFSGAGTTGMVALELGRNYIGIELNEEYVELSRRRIQKEMPLIAWGAGV